MSERYLGIDVGAETIKLAEVRFGGGEPGPELVRREIVEHHKEPGRCLVRALREWEWEGVTRAAVTGRLSRRVGLNRVPVKQALMQGFRFLHGNDPATVVSIGSHGFAVLEIRANGVESFRENNRCSQGTGNFLRQLVERFDLDVAEASELARGVTDAAELSSRCPVILKTDITHLANRGAERGHILAGLFDAICENVQALIKPGRSPEKVFIAGGVSRVPRVRESFHGFLNRSGMQLLPYDEQNALFLEAIGCAVAASGSVIGSAVASSSERKRPLLEALWTGAPDDALEVQPALVDFLDKVKRMPAKPVDANEPESPRSVIVGFDIGLTGSKAVAMDAERQEPIWESYLNTRGDPVGAARALAERFCEGPARDNPVVALGATGSGREIVGSLLTTCYGHQRVFIFNEIAAHSRGALHHDRRVDTIFEIGGQDAKYVRLEEGRVVDAAMNEACSAGTGSFIEEQGRRFEGVVDVVQMGQEALRAPFTVSLGQHCSVFMAEVIDEAVAAGMPQRAIIAGVYDSIIQNYLNRVKGNRSVGKVIFCQGMPFASDALAAAVARQTGSEVVVPPGPGTVGAFGIALLAAGELDLGDKTPLDLRRFLDARVIKKDAFICQSDQGCGGAGNRCHIERLTARVGDEKKRFTWGGACSLHDSGTATRKLPDRAPDPFRERRELFDELRERSGRQRQGRSRIALTDEFSLKELFPFFVTFFGELGFDVSVHSGADRRALRRGTEQASVPYCAPMKLYHGLVSEMAEQHPDFLFLPMLRSLPRVAYEPHAALCPIVQGSADLLRADLGDDTPCRVISPVIDVGPGNLRSERFIEMCRALSVEFGERSGRFQGAYERALAVQEEFRAHCGEIGRRALDFCAEKNLAPVVVLGRPYTIYNDILNSNVPAILREQGVIGIPVDCYPVQPEVPFFEDIYWAHGQRNLRAAHQIRRTPGVHAVWCSNYACGPDSFLLHFASHIMEGKPFTVIETDGHSGDAGTKTRIEAYLYCVREHLASGADTRQPNSLGKIERDRSRLFDARERDLTLLIPPMGCGSGALSACLRGQGFKAESLPTPDREALSLGRRNTSGKECLPMTITLGSLLQRLEKDRESGEGFAFFMPTSNGPCRFGVYSLLHKLTLEHLGWRHRVRVISPSDTDYFAGVPGGFSTLVFTAFVAGDVLQEAWLDVRSVESSPGAATEVYERYRRKLYDLLESQGEKEVGLRPALMQVATGRLFGIRSLLEQAARALREVRTDREVPTVLVSGEIYNRSDPFANDFIVDKLDERGIRVRLAPFTEWLEYTDYLAIHHAGDAGPGDRLSTRIRHRIQDLCHHAAGDVLGWHSRIPVEQMLDAASVYLREELEVESVLTIGSPLCEWREGLIDGVISTGPLECMPTKMSEAQFHHIAEHKGLPSLTLELNGDPVDPEILDTFVYEIKSRFRERRAANRKSRTAQPREAISESTSR